MRDTSLNRRYRLHVKLKKQGFRIDPRTNSILIAPDDLRAKNNKDVVELIENHNYQFQFEIQIQLFNPPKKVTHMITDAERTAIKTNIGKHYSLPIIARLNEKGIKPKEAEKWTVTMIQQIVLGHREHEAVELEIIQLVADRKAEKEAQLKKRLELIGQ